MVARKVKHLGFRFKVQEATHLKVRAISENIGMNEFYLVVTQVELGKLNHLGERLKVSPKHKHEYPFD